MIIGLVIIGLAGAVLALASKLREARRQLVKAESRLDDYADTFDLLAFGARIPADELRSMVDQPQPDRRSRDERK